MQAWCEPDTFGAWELFLNVIAVVVPILAGIIVLGLAFIAGDYITDRLYRKDQAPSKPPASGSLSSTESFDRTGDG